MINILTIAQAYIIHLRFICRLKWIILYSEVYDMQKIPMAATHIKIQNSINPIYSQLFKSLIGFNALSIKFTDLIRSENEISHKNKAYNPFPFDSKLSRSQSCLKLKAFSLIC